MITPKGATLLSEEDIFACQFWETEIDRRLCNNQQLKTHLPLGTVALEYLAEKYRDAGWTVTTNNQSLEFSYETNSNE